MVTSYPARGGHRQSVVDISNRSREEVHSGIGTMEKLRRLTGSNTTIHSSVRSSMRSDPAPDTSEKLLRSLTICRTN